MWRKQRSRRPGGLEQAQQTLEQAKAEHAEQARKREQENEGVIARMERLAADNHLAALVWDVMQGNGGH